jgi:flagellar basal body-associated protein FliL
MKKKDLMALVIAVAIMLVAGYLVYTQVMPQKSGAASQGVQVEVVGPIASDFDPSVMDTLSDSSKVRNFAVSLDLTTGLANPTIFGQ